MRCIRIDSRMPDHHVLEAGDLFWSLLHLDFAIVGLQSCESAGCGKNQFGSGNTPRRRSEIWQGNHGTTAMTIRCEALLRYMLRAFDDIDANVFGREILFESESALVGSVRCHNTDEFFLVNDLGQ